MDWITALLAFATTMLFFSVVVSTLVELLHRILRMREAGLHRMLRNYFDKVIRPSLAPGDPWHARGSAAVDFADAMTGNRAVSSGPGSAGLGIMAGLGEALSRWVDRFTHSARLSRLPAVVFMEKLATSDVFDGTRLGGAEGDRLLQDLGQKFEAFGGEMSEAFERQARVFSLVIALIVAIVFFVHPYRLAIAYLDDPVRAQKIADLREEILEKQRLLEASSGQAPSADAARNQGAVEGAGGAPAIARPDSTGEATASSGATSGGAQPQGQPAGTEPDPLDEIMAATRRLEAEVRTIADLGAPIGWPADEDIGSIAPCSAQTVPPQDGRTATASRPRSELAVFCVDGSGRVWPTPASWFWLLLGGILIGLGAPFWAKVIHAITPMKDVAGKIGEVFNGPRDKPVPQPPAGGTPAPDSETTRSVAVRAFRASARTTAS